MRCGLATAPRKTGLPRASIRKPADETKQADERDHYTLLLIYKHSSYLMKISPLLSEGLSTN
jgi:hypothetical protein